MTGPLRFDEDVNTVEIMGVFYERAGDVLIIDGDLLIAPAHIESVGEDEGSTEVTFVSSRLVFVPGVASADFIQALRVLDFI